MMNTLFALALPIYQVALKVDPVTLGLLMAIPRFVDLFFDPVMGNISDNTRTRWGRRRPYILAGAIGAAILLPLLWMPPFHTQAGIVAYFLVVCVLYTFCYTIFEIPYTALG
jgi:GPH family glycoside/pentoside/hexuronide:cation symporter